MAVLNGCKKFSKEWVSNHAGETKTRIREVERQCVEFEHKLATGNTDLSIITNLKEARGELWALLRREEREWIQKSRLKWAAEGDRNTKFFHLAASARRRNNFIGSLQVGNKTHNSPSKIKEEVGEYFRNFYNDSRAIPLKSFDCELSQISGVEAERLEREFSEQEIWFALSAMDSNKAPGPDGFNIGFLKKFWPNLKIEIMNFFRCFFKGEGVDWSFNQSFVVLIPKKVNPVRIEDFRPISLVGCIYKLVAKVLALRLKEVMEGIIGEQQFAFCPGRQILDCSLIANEVIEHHKRKKLEGVIFKADFFKAYDTIDWGFLMFIMKKMGFRSVWCQWIYSCISSANVSILVNGSPTIPFTIGRGLRQGCPLSPMLFNLVAEALSALLRKATVLGFFNGFSIGQPALEVSHLQFADDLIIFCGPSKTQIINIVRIFKGFEIAGGLKLNLSKTSLMGINVDEQVLNTWANFIHCKGEKLPCQYLGLPLGSSKNSATLWEPIMERLKKKCAGWKIGLLSFGGRVTLIKSVLSSLPIYYLSLFRIPKAVNISLSKLIARFLWGSTDKKVIHWVRWEQLCLPLECGGLGLVDFNVRNKALLNKWLWRFGLEPNSLWRKIINAKYRESESSLLPGNLSTSNKCWMWKNIISTLNDADDVFKQNIKLAWSIEHVERLANGGCKGCDLTMRCGFARSTLLCEKVVDG
ncbi:hypothetical protein GQ457_01G025880 [Hibiscus cannabinus]